jgi:hypothetical protein
VQVFQLAEFLGAVGNHAHHRCAGGLGPLIGDQVRDGYIDLMPDGRHDRHLRLVNGLGHFQSVEGGEVLAAAAPACQNNDIER